MEGHFVCDECGERTADPVTLECRICGVAAERDELREAAESMALSIESLFSSLPFSAPENVAYLAQAKLSDALAEYRGIGK